MDPDIPNGTLRTIDGRERIYTFGNTDRRTAVIAGGDKDDAVVRGHHRCHATALDRIIGDPMIRLGPRGQPIVICRFGDSDRHSNATAEFNCSRFWAATT